MDPLHYESQAKDDLSIPMCHAHYTHVIMYVTHTLTGLLRASEHSLDTPTSKVGQSKHATNLIRNGDQDQATNGRKRS